MTRKRTEHPEDRAIRLESEGEARRFGPAILKDYHKNLEGLILMYAESEALRALERLREMFWAFDLPRAVRNAEKATK